MIKQFIETVEDIAIKAMLKYIDSENDERKKEIKELRKELELLRKQVRIFEDTAKIVTAFSDLSKLIKKSVVGAVVTAIVGWILFQLGIVGG